jgi:hypothetical protein
MKKGGAALAGPIWNKFINEALKTMPKENFEAPVSETAESLLKPVLRGSWMGNENFFVDKISGKLATENTPKETIEERILTNVHSILYWVDRNDITGEPPRDPSDNPQFDNWEIPVQNWWAQNQGRYPIVTVHDKPNMEDDVHTDESKPRISITEPDERTVYSPNQDIYVKISSFGPYPLQKMDVFVNDAYLGTSDPNSLFSFTPSELEYIQEENELRVIAYDSVFNKGEATLVFKVGQ